MWLWYHTFETVFWNWLKVVRSGWLLDEYFDRIIIHDWFVKKWIYCKNFTLYQLFQVLLYTVYYKICICMDYCYQLCHYITITWSPKGEYRPENTSLNTSCHIIPAAPLKIDSIPLETLLNMFAFISHALNMLDFS